MMNTATQVKRYEIPEWIAIKLRSIKKRDNVSGGTLYTLVQNTDRYRSTKGWLDHYGTAVDKDGHDCFVSEPYGLASYDIIKLQNFCVDFECQFELDPVSFHYPGSTIRIWIFQ